MYVRRHKVRKGARSYVYLRLVEAYRDEAGKVRHRLVATLGREDQLKASGQLAQLAASFARLDPPAAGTRRLVRPLPLVAHYPAPLRLARPGGSRCPGRGPARLTPAGRHALRAGPPAGVSVSSRPHKGWAWELPAFTEALGALAAALPPGVVIVADSGLGYGENLGAAAARHVRFVAPLRADTGWAARFDADAGPLGGLAALQALDHVSHRERRLPATRRTTSKGLLRPLPATSQDR